MTIRFAVPILPLVAAAVGLVAVLSFSRTAHAGDCNDTQKTAITKALVNNDPDTINKVVKIGCTIDLNFNRDLEFPPNRPKTVLRRIVVQGANASGTRIDCAGIRIDGGYGTPNYRQTMLAVLSQWDNHARDWNRPEDVTISNCPITGSTSTIGIAANANDPKYKPLSSESGYVGYIRARAPKNILFYNVDITTVGLTPIYLGPGTEGFTLKGSTIDGYADDTVIYLGAETTRNKFLNNDIRVVAGREQISVDASDHNKFIGNRFNGLDTGGIHLYRNCGEDGTSRHTTPSYNHIVGNTFYYARDFSITFNPAIYLGSRDGDRSYCDKDDGSGYGSGNSDYDHARYNIILDNQIVNRSVEMKIRTRDRFSHPNYELYNESVDVFTSRPLACAVPNGYRRKGLLHGESLELWDGDADVPECTGKRVTCMHGKLKHSTTSDCNIQRVDFECRNGNEDECSRVASCPAGSAIVGAVAACDLLNGSVTNAELVNAALNTVRVATPAQDSSAGVCWVGLDSANEYASGIDVEDLGGWRTNIGCSESDASGVCEIRGSLYCRSWGTQSQTTDDLLWQSNSGQLHFWPMRDSQRLTGLDVSTPVHWAWKPKDVGDLNGDGIDDIIFRQNNGQVHYWPIKNGQRQSGINIDVPVSSAWTIRALGDVNGDGTDDIIWQHVGGKVYVWPMNNAQRQGGHGVASPVDSAWTLAGSGDVDGDGTDDIVWKHSSGRVHYWKMLNGQHAGAYDIATPVGDDMTLAAVGDVNGDGTDDLVWRVAGERLRVWSMQYGQRARVWDIRTPDSGSWTLVGVGNLDAIAGVHYPWNEVDMAP